jgi:hypothetical protein
VCQLRHACKSAAGSASARPLVALFARLEESAPAGDADALSDLAREVISEFARVESEVRALLRASWNNQRRRVTSSTPAPTRSRAGSPAPSSPDKRRSGRR